MTSISPATVFLTKYLGPTNTKGSRIKVTDTKRGESKTFTYDGASNHPFEQAVLDYYWSEGGSSLVTIPDVHYAGAIRGDALYLI